MDTPAVTSPTIHKALYKELDELNTYARSHMQLFLSWFAFFCGINIVALGWLATATPKPLIRDCITFNFIIQGLLAVIACRTVHSNLVSTDLRIEAILRQIDKSGFARSPLPCHLYVRATILIASACLILVGVWVTIVFGKPNGMF